MSRKKEKQEPYVYEYTRKLRKVEPLLNQPTDMITKVGDEYIINEKEVNKRYNDLVNDTIDKIKAEIKRVNAILRTTKNPHEYRQNKKYLERLERKLKLYGK